MSHCTQLNPQARAIPALNGVLQHERYDPPRNHSKAEFCQLASQATVRYFLVCPQVIHEQTPVVVVVHGISRGAKEQADIFSILAEKNRAIVIAPLFDETYFKGYQRPGLAEIEKQSRSDLALNAILEEITQQYSVDTSQFSLFGYSGGAQFSHRYALLYPERIRRLVIAAAGWYSFPDAKRPYPYGLKSDALDPELQLHIDGFLQIPTLLLSGSNDTQRDIGLNKSKKIDRQQGRNRLSRAHNWISAMQLAGEQRSIEIQITHQMIENANHDFAKSVQLGALHDRVRQFFFPE